MDTPVGRSLLHMELDALRNALSGDSSALKDALTIRTYRQNMFPNNNEAEFERHEGVAEYTGLRIAFETLADHLVKQTVYDYERGYTNASGYITGTLYLHFLEQIDPMWAQKHNTVDICSALKDKYGIKTTNVESKISDIKNRYNYKTYHSKEAKAVKNIGKYSALMNPEKEKLCIYNTDINMAFNPNNRVITIGSSAVLLKAITLTSEWGRLEVTGNIIRMNDWSSFILPPPGKSDEKTVTGKDYTITLNPGFGIVKNDKIWKIVKKNNK